VFAYARRCLTSRPSLWVAGTLCALILALPGAFIATIGVRSVTMLLLTGDVLLALDVLPEPARSGWLATVSVVGVVILALAYNRLYAVLLWASDERHDGGWRASWDATRGRWTKVLALNAGFLAATVVAVLAVALLVGIALGAPGLATTLLLGGATAVVVGRTIGRIFVTLAARSAVLENAAVRDAWRTARGTIKERRRDVVAAWATLVAAGAALWLGGRVVSPILQDTALDFPAYSFYTFAREGAQLAFAVPLEAFLMIFATGIWTALYLGVDNESPQAAQPLMPRALAGVVVLAIIGNGIPAVLDVSWRTAQDSEVADLRATGITGAEALRPAAALTGPDRYVVDARLDGQRLEWSTRVTYTNGTTGALTEIPVHVYPAAFERDVEDMPLADDVLSGSVPADVRARVEQGSFTVAGVADSQGKRLSWRDEGTVLRVRPTRPLPPAEAVTFEIDLEADLPVWPVRFGTWEDVVQLGNWIPTVPPESGRGFRIHPYEQIGDPFFAEVADYDVSIELADTMGAAGSGVLASVTDEGNDRKVWRFVASGARDAAFVAARGLRGFERRAGGTVVRGWYTGDNSIAANDLVGDAASAVDTYSRDFGALTFDEVDVMLTESPLGGMEYPGLVFVSVGFPELEGLPLLPEMVEHAGFGDELRRYIAGHEVAHQWWYADVGNDQVTAPWLDEAFAEASTRTWLEREDGHDITWSVAHLERSARPQKGAIDASVGDFESNADYSDVIYDAGGAILIELRDLIGAPSFNRLMTEWHRTLAGRIGTIEAFIELTNEVAGPRASALLESYRD
jgi:hypothetical protein